MNTAPVWPFPPLSGATPWTPAQILAYQRSVQHSAQAAALAQASEALL